MRLICNWKFAGGSAFKKSMRSLFKTILRLCLSLCFLATAFAGVGGSISGTIQDLSGAAIPKASVTVINTSTGVLQSSTADSRDTYTFPVLPVGAYALDVSQPGFKPYRRTGITLDANSALLLDVVLQVGERTDAITVNENAVHVETSSSQMGEVIPGTTMTEVPLNGRSYTDLLSLQSGVAPNGRRLYSPFSPPSRSPPRHIHHLQHGAGCWRQRLLALRRLEPRH